MTRSKNGRDGSNVRAVNNQAVSEGREGSGVGVSRVSLTQEPSHHGEQALEARTASL